MNGTSEQQQPGISGHCCCCCSFEHSATKCREDQDLAVGAVLESTTEAGQGTDTPQEGDLVRQLLQLLLCIH
jgi:hypothetical protein